MGSRLGRSEENWKRQINWSCNTHIHETTQGNSLCSYLYLKLAKRHVSLFIYFGFFSYKIREHEGGTGSVGEGGGVVEKGVR
jgi:hypothetical protein